MYQKEIRYLYLWDNNEKQKAVGCIRNIIQNESVDISVRVDKAQEIMDGEYEIFFHHTDSVRSDYKINLKNGQGCWNYKGENPDCEQLEIILYEGKKIAQFCRRTKENSNQNSNIMTEQSIPEMEAENPTEPDGRTQSTEEKLPAENNKAKSAEANAQEVYRHIKKSNDIKKDKWEQLLSEFDIIHPFGDERVYLRLEPKDIIILQEKYQHLANNSFLLHGFYNYKYLILGKEHQYFLGVPGNYYEREKMVAVMFGFDHFEGGKKEYRDGDFGYYLRKVEI